MKEVVQNPGLLEDWYKGYFIPNNPQVVSTYKLKELGLLTDEGHSYNDEAYRLKEPIVLKETEANKKIDDSDVPFDLDDNNEGSEEDIIPDDTNIDVLEAQNEEIPIEEDKEFEEHPEQLNLFDEPSDEELPDDEIDECFPKKKFKIKRGGKR